MERIIRTGVRKPFPALFNLTQITPEVDDGRLLILCFNTVLLLILLVPVTIGLGICESMFVERHRKIYRWLYILSFVSAFYYSLRLVLFIPFAFMCLLFFGAGLIPLSPYIALLCLLWLKRYREARRQIVLPSILKLLAISLLAYLVLESPRLATHVSAQMAMSENPATQSRGLTLLRTIGRKSMMNRACYPSSKLFSGEVEAITSKCGRRISQNELRTLFYRTYGQAFNEIKPPKVRGVFSGSMVDSDDWDYGHGGDEVAGRIRGLSLHSSLVDGVLYPDEAVAYLEWTLEFKNSSDEDREARLQIQLPPGSVVSRTTLWVDGEEREAAYASRGKAKKAYRKVAVVQRRDPVLVTTSGPDQVLVQCFPVPQNGGTIKTKIGITVPLDRIAEGRVVLSLPKIAEHNFAISTVLNHQVWIDGNREIIGSTIGETTVSEGQNLFRTTIDHETFQGPCLVMAACTPRAGKSWATDISGNEVSYIVQSLTQKNVAKGGTWVFVIDGSRLLKGYRSQINTWISDVPDNQEIIVILAGDSPTVIHEGLLNDNARVALEQGLERFNFIGGRDAVPALELAWERIQNDEAGLLVWLHGPQPVELASTGGLIQRWSRVSNPPKVQAVTLVPGPNVVAKALHENRSIRHLSWSHNPELDPFSNHIRQWSSGEGVWQRSFELVNKIPDLGREATSHIVRLWAWKRVQILQDNISDASKKAALNLAVKYQLVTPLTGAVVLENAEQYATADLQPADGLNSPHIVPEPGTGLLMFLGAVFLSRFVRNRNK